jgi:hypothetical protein
MTPSRRSLVLAAAFLGLAVLLSWDRPVRAQQPPIRAGGFGGRGGIGPEGPSGSGGGNWQPVPADKVRDAFNRGGRNPNLPNAPGELPPEFERLVPGLTAEFKQQFPDLDPRLAEPTIRQLLGREDIQQLDPRLVDSIVRTTLRDPAKQRQIREAVNDAKKNGGTPPGTSRAAGGGNPPPDIGKALPKLPGEGNNGFRPNPGTGPFGPPSNGDPKFDPGSGPEPGPSPSPRVGTKPDVKVGVTPNPDPKTGPSPIPDPNAGPSPMTDPKNTTGSKIGPNEGPKPGPGKGPGDPRSINPPDKSPTEPSRPGKEATTRPTEKENPTRPVPTPKNVQQPDRSGAKDQPGKDAWQKDGFRSPGTPDPNQDLGKTTQEKRRLAAQALYERYVGKLDDTPAVKRALFDLVDETTDLRDSEGNTFWDTLTKEGGDGSSFDWMDRTGGGDGWKFDFDWGRSDGSGSSSSGDSWWSRRNSSSSSSSSSPRSGSGGVDFGVPGLEGSVLPLIILAALIVGGLLLWKFLYFRNPRPAGPAFELAGLGEWPIDPRAIATREDLVKAFEYLSVMICGPAARMWTHSTIASALADLATTDSEAAMILARLYELARYAPLDEPLTPAEIEEARHLVCQLAGVSYP